MYISPNTHAPSITSRSHDTPRSPPPLTPYAMRGPTLGLGRASAESGLCRRRCAGAAALMGQAWQSAVWRGGKRLEACESVPAGHQLQKPKLSSIDSRRCQVFLFREIGSTADLMTIGRRPPRKV